MVRERRKPSKSNQIKDFRKRKVKVGRRISKKQASQYNNVVDTNIFSKSIIVRKKAAVEEDELTSIATELTKFLPLTEHHSKNTRKHAFENFVKILQTHHINIPKEMLPPIIDKCRTAFLDVEKEVRDEALKVLEFLIISADVFDMTPFLHIITLQILIALGSLTSGVRITGLRALNVLLKSEKYNVRLVKDFKLKLNEAFIVVLRLVTEMVGTKTTSLEKHCQVSLNTFKLFLELAEEEEEQSEYKASTKQVLASSTSPHFILKQFNFSVLECLDNSEETNPLKNLDNCIELLKISLSKNFVGAACEASFCILFLIQRLCEGGNSEPDLPSFLLKLLFLLQEFPLRVRNIGRFSHPSLQMNFCMISAFQLLQQELADELPQLRNLSTSNIYSFALETIQNSSNLEFPDEVREALLIFLQDAGNSYHDRTVLEILNVFLKDSCELKTANQDLIFEALRLHPPNCDDSFLRILKKIICNVSNNNEFYSRMISYLQSCTQKPLFKDLKAHAEVLNLMLHPSLQYYIDFLAAESAII